MQIRTNTHTHTLPCMYVCTCVCVQINNTTGYTAYRQHFWSTVHVGNFRRQIVSLATFSLAVDLIKENMRVCQLLSAALWLLLPYAHITTCVCMYAQRSVVYVEKSCMRQYAYRYVFVTTNCCRCCCLLLLFGPMSSLNCCCRCCCGDLVTELMYCWLLWFIIIFIIAACRVIETDLCQ